MSSSLNFTLLIFTIVVLLPHGTLAFGAGDIPSFAYLENKAFRHGDIENILAEIAKGASMAAGGGGILGFAKQVIQSTANGGKFTKSDIKKVYFGNWLRDYSQCMDIAGLSKLTADTLVLIVGVLGFMTFGFATEEFQVTAERLGVYLPVEHIDNPKGYAEKEGDAREYHPQLRPPVNPRELEIDERTGMKNYIASEGRGWDTSTAHVRRVFRACIEHGRRAGGQEGPDLWEAYRLLGTGLHTCEDFTAHSNWCEIALRKLGHEEVFCHVGDGTFIDTPGGRAPPLVTGTFGGADFLHSLMGEATDHISQASVTSLSEKMNQASKNDASQIISKIKGILSKTGGDDKIAEGEDLQQKSQAYRFDPNNVAPQEVQQQLYALLVWRDSVYREVLSKIEMIPGLSDLIEQLTDSLNAYVYTVLAPWVTPILEQATSVLGEGSKAVIDTADQYEVFESDSASDPSHSLLSKDHFGLILNEPAGLVARVVVVHSAELVIRAWSDDSDPDRVIDQILEVFHHPYYATGRSRIQHEMLETLQKWLGGLGPDQTGEVIQALTKESVRNGKNKRRDEQNSGFSEPGYGPSKSSYDQGSYEGNIGRTTGQSQGYRRHDDNSRRQTESQYTESSAYQKEYDSHANESLGYGQSEEYGRDRDDSRRQYDQRGNQYGRNKNEFESQNRNTYGRESESYDGQRHHGRNDEARPEGHGRSEYSRESGGGNRYQDSYPSSGQEYGGGGRYGQRGDESNTYGGSTRYNTESYANRQREDSGYDREAESYGNRQQHDYNRSDNYESQREDIGYNQADHYSNRQIDSNRSDNYGNQQREGNDYRRSEANRYDSSRGTNEGNRNESASYNPSYSQESGYVGRSNEYDQDETYGAERLNIRDDEEGYGSRRHQNEYERDY